MIEKYHWNTAFYASNFQDFQNFSGRCPEPRLEGLQRPPRLPAGLRGASRPAAQSAAGTLSSKNLSQTTLGLWPATPLVIGLDGRCSAQAEQRKKPMAVGPLPGAYLSTETNLVPIRGVMKKEFDTGQTDRQTASHAELKRRGPPGPRR